MSKTKNKYRFMAKLDIINKYLPSPIMVMVCSNSRTYINKYFENKIINICQQYNYIGYVDICIKFIRGSKSITYKTIYVCKNKILEEPRENMFEKGVV